MDGVDRGRRRRTKKSLKERLGLNGMACCGGSTWGLRPTTTMSVREEEDDDDDDIEGGGDPPQSLQEQHDQHHRHQLIEASATDDVGQITPENIRPGTRCVGQIPTASGMNLATALAVERLFRSTQDSMDGSNAVAGPTGATTEGTTAPGTPLRVSLMRLLEESDGVDGGGGGETTEKENGAGSDCVCCVCMGRKKGSAFIPCGHTFCRVCSRELWLNRGSCPLCNRSILEILDIF